MKCVNCGYELDDNLNECPKCGYLFTPTDKINAKTAAIAAGSILATGLTGVGISKLVSNNKTDAKETPIVKLEEEDDSNAIVDNTPIVDVPKEHVPEIPETSESLSPEDPTDELVIDNTGMYKDEENNDGLDFTDGNNNSNTGGNNSNNNEEENNDDKNKDDEDNVDDVDDKDNEDGEEDKDNTDTGNNNPSDNTGGSNGGSNNGFTGYPSMGGDGETASTYSTPSSNDESSSGSYSGGYTDRIDMNYSSLCNALSILGAYIPEGGVNSSHRLTSCNITLETLTEEVSSIYIKAEADKKCSTSISNRSRGIATCAENIKTLRTSLQETYNILTKDMTLVQKELMYKEDVTSLTNETGSIDESVKQLIEWGIFDAGEEEAAKEYLSSATKEVFDAWDNARKSLNESNYNESWLYKRLVNSYGDNLPAELGYNAAKDLFGAYGDFLAGSLYVNMLGETINENDQSGSGIVYNDFIRDQFDDGFYKNKNDNDKEKRYVDHRTKTQEQIRLEKLLYGNGLKNEVAGIDLGIDYVEEINDYMNFIMSEDKSTLHPGDYAYDLLESGVKSAAFGVFDVESKGENIKQCVQNYNAILNTRTAKERILTSQFEELWKLTYDAYNTNGAEVEAAFKQMNLTEEEIANIKPEDLYSLKGYEGETKEAIDGFFDSLNKLALYNNLVNYTDGENISVWGEINESISKIDGALNTDGTINWQKIYSEVTVPGLVDIYCDFADNNRSIEEYYTEKINGTTGGQTSKFNEIIYEIKHEDGTVESKNVGQEILDKLNLEFKENYLERDAYAYELDKSKCNLAIAINQQANTQDGIALNNNSTMEYLRTYGGLSSANDFLVSTDNSATISDDVKNIVLNFADNEERLNDYKDAKYDFLKLKESIMQGYDEDFELSATERQFIKLEDARKSEKNKEFLDNTNKLLDDVKNCDDLEEMISKINSYTRASDERDLNAIDIITYNDIENKEDCKSKIAKCVDKGGLDYNGNWEYKFVYYDEDGNEIEVSQIEKEIYFAQHPDYYNKLTEGSYENPPFTLNEQEHITALMSRSSLNLDILNYKVNTGSEEEIQEWYKYNIESANLKTATLKHEAYVSKLEKYGGLGDFLYTAGYATTKGVDQFFDGLLNTIYPDGMKSTNDYLGMLNSSYLASTSSVLSMTYDISVSIGNMLPVIVVSAALGPFGEAAGMANVVNLVANIPLGLSSMGNKVEQCLQEGKSKEVAYATGATIGLLEIGTQYALGGIVRLAKDGAGFITRATQTILKSDDIGVAIVKGITSAAGHSGTQIAADGLAALAIKSLTDMASEGFEEGLQTILEVGVDNLFEFGFTSKDEYNEWLEENININDAYEVLKKEYDDYRTQMLETTDQTQRAMAMAMGMDTFIEQNYSELNQTELNSILNSYLTSVKNTTHEDWKKENLEWVDFNEVLKSAIYGSITSGLMNSVTNSPAFYSYLSTGSTYGVPALWNQIQLHNMNMNGGSGTIGNFFRNMNQLRTAINTLNAEGINISEVINQQYIGNPEFEKFYATYAHEIEEANRQAFEAKEKAKQEAAEKKGETYTPKEYTSKNAEIDEIAAKTSLATNIFVSQFLNNYCGQIVGYDIDLVRDSALTSMELATELSEKQETLKSKKEEKQNLTDRLSEIKSKLNDKTISSKDAYSLEVERNEIEVKLNGIDKEINSLNDRINHIETRQVEVRTREEAVSSNFNEINGEIDKVLESKIKEVSEKAKTNKAIENLLNKYGLSVDGIIKLVSELDSITSDTKTSAIDKIKKLFSKDSNINVTNEETLRTIQEISELSTAIKDLSNLKSNIKEVNDVFKKVVSGKGKLTSDELNLLISNIDTSVLDLYSSEFSDSLDMIEDMEVVGLTSFELTSLLNDNNTEIINLCGSELVSRLSELSRDNLVKLCNNMSETFANAHTKEIITALYEMNMTNKIDYKTYYECLTMLQSLMTPESVLSSLVETSLAFEQARADDLTTQEKQNVFDKVSSSFKALMDRTVYLRENTERMNQEMTTLLNENISKLETEISELEAKLKELDDVSKIKETTEEIEKKLKSLLNKVSETSKLIGKPIKKSYLKIAEKLGIEINSKESSEITAKESKLTTKELRENTEKLLKLAKSQKVELNDILTDITSNFNYINGITKLNSKSLNYLVNNLSSNDLKIYMNKILSNSESINGEVLCNLIPKLSSKTINKYTSSIGKIFDELGEFYKKITPENQTLCKDAYKSLVSKINNNSLNEFAGKILDNLKLADNQTINELAVKLNKEQLGKVAKSLDETLSNEEFNKSLKDFNAIDIVYNKEIISSKLNIIDETVFNELINNLTKDSFSEFSDIISEFITKASKNSSSYNYLIQNMDIKLLNNNLTTIMENMDSLNDETVNYLLEEANSGRLMNSIEKLDTTVEDSVLNETIKGFNKLEIFINMNEILSNLDRIDIDALHNVILNSSSKVLNNNSNYISKVIDKLGTSIDKQNSEIYNYILNNINENTIKNNMSSIMSHLSYINSTELFNLLENMKENEIYKYNDVIFSKLKLLESASSVDVKVKINEVESNIMNIIENVVFSKINLKDLSKASEFDIKALNRLVENLDIRNVELSLDKILKRSSLIEDTILNEFILKIPKELIGKYSYTFNDILNTLNKDNFLYNRVSEYINSGINIAKTENLAGPEGIEIVELPNEEVVESKSELISKINKLNPSLKEDIESFKEIMNTTDITKMDTTELAEFISNFNKFYISSDEFVSFISKLTPDQISKCKDSITSELDVLSKYDNSLNKKKNLDKINELLDPSLKAETKEEYNIDDIVDEVEAYEEAKEDVVEAKETTDEKLETKEGLPNELEIEKEVSAYLDEQLKGLSHATPELINKAKSYLSEKIDSIIDKIVKIKDIDNIDMETKESTAEKIDAKESLSNELLIEKEVTEYLNEQLKELSHATPELINKAKSYFKNKIDSIVEKIAEKKAKSSEYETVFGEPVEFNPLKDITKEKLTKSIKSSKEYLSALLLANDVDVLIENQEILPTILDNLDSRSKSDIEAYEKIIKSIDMSKLSKDSVSRLLNSTMKFNGTSKSYIELASKLTKSQIVESETQIKSQLYYLMKSEFKESGEHYYSDVDAEFNEVMNKLMSKEDIVVDEEVKKDVIEAKEEVTPVDEVKDISGENLELRMTEEVNKYLNSLPNASNLAEKAKSYFNEKLDSIIDKVIKIGNIENIDTDVKETTNEAVDNTPNELEIEKEVTKYLNEQLKGLSHATPELVNKAKSYFKSKMDSIVDKIAEKKAKNSKLDDVVDFYSDTIIDLILKDKIDVSKESIIFLMPIIEELNLKNKNDRLAYEKILKGINTSELTKENASKLLNYVYFNLSSDSYIEFASRLTKPQRTELESQIWSQLSSLKNTEFKETGEHYYSDVYTEINNIMKEIMSKEDVVETKEADISLKEIPRSYDEVNLYLKDEIAKGNYEVLVHGNLTVEQLNDIIQSVNTKDINNIVDVILNNNIELLEEYFKTQDIITIINTMFNCKEDIFRIINANFITLKQKIEILDIIKGNTDYKLIKYSCDTLEYLIESIKNELRNNDYNGPKITALTEACGVTSGYKANGLSVLNNVLLAFTTDYYEAKMKMFDNGFGVQKSTIELVQGIPINIIIEDVNNYTKVLAEIKRCQSYFEELPIAFRSLLKEVNIYDQSDPGNYAAAIKYYNDILFDFVSDASCSGEIMYIWDITMSGGKGAFAHEIGHILDKEYNLLKNGKGKTYFYSESSWQAIVDLDDKGAVSNYGGTKIYEDFADSVRYYFTDYANFVREYPHRAAQIELMLKELTIAKYDLNNVNSIKKFITKVERLGIDANEVMSYYNKGIALNDIVNAYIENIAYGKPVNRTLYNNSFQTTSQFVKDINELISTGQTVNINIRNAKDITVNELMQITDLSKVNFVISGIISDMNGNIKQKYNTQKYISRHTYTGNELLAINIRLDELQSKIDMNLPISKRAKQLYELIASEYSYMSDFDESRDTVLVSQSLRGIVSNNIVGRQGLICAGFASLYKELCDRCEIPCDYVRGVVPIDRLTGRGEKHAWNVVIDENGNQIPVDVTWRSGGGDHWFGKSQKFAAKHIADSDEVFKNYQNEVEVFDSNVNKIISDVISIMDAKYGYGKGIEALKMYLQTDNLNLITRTNGARDAISKINMIDIDNYLNNAYNGLS